MDSITFGTTTITYEIAYSNRRKHVAIAVNPDKRVEVLAPSHLDQLAIQDLVRKKASWVKEQLEWFDQINHLTASKEYVNGETFLYLGRQYRLKILCGGNRPSAKLRGKYFEATLPEHIEYEDRHKAIKRVLWKWYRDHAEKKIGELIQSYSSRLHIDPPAFRVKYQAKRWGSCSKDNGLNINLRISMAPMSQIEYVVAHELCHQKYKDHSAEFWKLMRLVMPDYEIRKENLRRDGWRYVI